MFYLINLIASKTGMRLGKIQALKIENLKNDHIIVKHSWDRAYGLQSTKTGKTRIVPINFTLYTEVSEYIKETVYKGPFIFSNKNGVKPITRTYIYNSTYDAFGNIGIDEKEHNLPLMASLLQYATNQERYPITHHTGNYRAF